MQKTQHHTPSAESVWKIIEETNRIVQEVAIQSRETDRKFQETEKMIQEVAAQSRETDKQFQETKKMMQEMTAEMRAQSRETERELEKTIEVVRDVSRRVGDLGNRLGEFVEHMVAPSVLRLFQEQGIEVHTVIRNLAMRGVNGGIEIDVLVLNQGTLIAVECKSKLTREHVDEHVARLEKLKHYMPVYANHRALGAVAAMVIDDAVQEYAQSQGLYVLRQSGDGVMLGNAPGFVPRAW